MRWYDPLLYPFAILYDGATRFRNRMFEIGQKRSTVFTIPTVVVGNLSLGGTGKTPMVEFLIDLLKEKLMLATLSRGYGRKTTGFLMANEFLGAGEIGDEPFQLYSKYKDRVAVAVGEERVLAIPQILIHHPRTELILLDDAFQHRYLQADYYILLTTYQQPFFKDSVLPLGTLRENRKGAKRADLIIVTKCPDLQEDEKSSYKAEILKYASPGCPIIFTGIKYGEPYHVFGQMDQLQKKVILLSGIADDRLLRQEIRDNYELIDVMAFPDHHAYTLADVQSIKTKLLEHPGTVILTTEKDAVKLKAPDFSDYIREIPIFALPISVSLNNEERQFIQNQIVKIVKDKGYISKI